MPETDAEEDRETAAPIDPAAISALAAHLGRLRWVNRTPEERSAHMRMMVQARWTKAKTTAE